MNIKRVVAVSLDARKDVEVIAKLNAVAPFHRKKVATLAKDILNEKLDEMIASLGITVDYSQGS